MSDSLKYGGYTARVEFSAEDRVFFGKLDNVTDLISFEGETVAEVKQAFAEAVDDYLALCATAGKEPEKSFKAT